MSRNLAASIYKVSCYRKVNKSLYIISILCTFIKLLYLPDYKTTHPYLSSVFMTMLRQKMIKLQEKFLPFIRVWYLWLGCYHFLSNTLCQFRLRFIIMIKKYTGTAILVCMTGCDNAPSCVYSMDCYAVMHCLLRCWLGSGVTASNAIWLWLLIVSSRMHGFTALSWKCMAALVRGEMTELMLLSHYLLLLLSKVIHGQNENFCNLGQASHHCQQRKVKHFSYNDKQYYHHHYQSSPPSSPYYYWYLFFYLYFFYHLYAGYLQLYN